LSELASVIRQTELDSHDRVGQLIWSLHVSEIDLTDSEDIDNLATILMYATRLKHLFLPNGITVICLALISQNVRHTLQYLKLPGDIAEPRHSAARYIERFQNLLTLDLGARPNKDGMAEVNQWPDFGWTMPHLQHLMWKGGKSELSDEQDAVFLSKCRFDSLRTLWLFLPLIQSSNDSFQALKTFLCQHAFVEEISLSCPSYEAMAMLLPLIKSTILTILGRVPTNAVSLIPQAVRVFAFGSRPDGAVACALLEQLLSGAHCIEQIQIEIFSGYDMRFVWKAAESSAKMALFVAKMLPYAAKLKARRGILLLDEDDQAIDIFSAYCTFLSCYLLS
jgi:hypothetical protein